MSKLKIKRIGEDGSIYTSGDIKGGGGIDEAQMLEYLKPYATTAALNSATLRITTLEASSLNNKMIEALEHLVPTKDNSKEFLSSDYPLYLLNSTGFYLNAAKVCNDKCFSGTSSKSYDLILGNYDDNDENNPVDSYIKIASTRSKNDDGELVLGNIDIYSKGDMNIRSLNNFYITDRYSYIKTKELKMSIKSGEVSISDLVKVKIDKEISFKTSSSNSMRLIEGEGFKIFTNLYATQDHVTDISDFTEDELAILKTNTVLKLLLQFNKRITELENKLKQS